MSEEKKDEKSQVESEEAPQGDSEGTSGTGTAYERKALDPTGRDWSKRKTFKPEGTV
jgi:hypothetical protein